MDSEDVSNEPVEGERICEDEEEEEEDDDEEEEEEEEEEEKEEEEEEELPTESEEVRSGDKSRSPCVGKRVASEGRITLPSSAISPTLS